MKKVNEKSENGNFKMSNGRFEALELFFCKPKIRMLQFSKFPTFQEVHNFNFLTLRVCNFFVDTYSFGATEAHLNPVHLARYLKKSTLHA